MSQATHRTLVLLNAALTLVSLSAPWLYFPPDVLPSLGMTHTGWQLIGRYTMTLALLGVRKGDVSGLLLAPIPIGAASASALALLTGGRALLGSNTRRHVLEIPLLVGSSMLLLLAPLSAAAKQIWPPLWGYWGVLAAILFSVLLSVLRPRK